ncbi:DUF2231 domain-containing protein [Gracilimonas sediminicola]|uniref:DUF2231 domain-containing protein n=1 Tax=Gracilimonas sediminicola TaxID=2952158 RepID=A0A9X2L1F0_9BACT|nr:DUF2231 domain-containing protein [Gracilimonas sediminicola]MCP9290556.1 hypothetical protein [Gracilimonas sediminicola]
MNELFDYAPNIHPMIVHFPIAILILAIGLNLIAFFLPEKWWDEKKTTLLYVLGSLSAIITYFTGQSAADSVFLPTQAQSVLTNHADWALYTVLFFSIYSCCRLILHWVDKMKQSATPMLMFLLALPGLFLLFQTGEHGATMVYGYGVGTGQYLEEAEKSNPEPTVATQDTSITSTFIKKENGDWIWDMSASAVNDLEENFHWIKGDIDQLNPTVSIENNTTYLTITAQQEIDNLFVTHSTYQNIQLDVYIDITSFNGEIQLVHHLQDDQNYDFVTLTSNGEIVQGRIENGQTEIFADKAYQNDDLKFIRAVGDGTHFRGYINKEMAVHGHGDTPEKGNVGLRIKGSGTIKIQNIEFSQL